MPYRLHEKCREQAGAELDQAQLKLGFDFKNLRFFNFRAQGLNFVLALEPRVFKLDGSSFGIRPYIYVLKECYKDTPQK